MTCLVSDNWRKVQTLTNAHFLRLFGITSSAEVGEIRSIRADQLLSPLRFDIFAKCIYAKFLNDQIDSNFGREIYLEHIRAFNHFNEGDGSGKSGPEGFLDAFHDILASVRSDGFVDSRSLIPVTRERVVIDGSHRVAAAVCHDKNVTIVELDTPGFTFDYRFFRDRGMPAELMDAAALEFCRLRHDAYVVLIFPSAVGRHDRILEILNEHGQVFYEKPVYLSRRGGFNLIREVYDGQPWIGHQKNRFAGASNKAQACFAQNNPLRVLVYSAESLEDVNEAKAAIRRLFQIENHSVHINDTHEEAISMAQMLMNENSIHWLNKAPACALPGFSRQFELFRQWLIAERLPIDSFCIDGSGALGAYGIREPADIDFVHHGHAGITTGMPEVSSHNDQCEHHGVTIDDLIFDPRNHFYWKGIKFVSLGALRRMKTRRGEPKDVRDVRLMTRCLETDKYLLLGKICYEVDRRARRVQSRLKNKAAIGIKSVKQRLSGLLPDRIRLR